MTDMQLAGGSAVVKFQTASRSAIVTVAQLANSATLWFRASVLSTMQAEYCATVAVQFAGMGRQISACLDWLAR